MLDDSSILPLQSGAPELTPAANRPQMPHTCVPCRHRKVKCDRQSPCSNCTRMSVECVPSVPSRLPRGRKGGRKKKVADDGLSERIARLEGMMKDYAALANSTAPSITIVPLASPASSNGPRASQNKTQYHNSNQYMGTSFWVTLSEEISGLKEILYDASDDEEADGVEQTIPQKRIVETSTTHGQQTVPAGLQFIFPMNMSTENFVSPTPQEIFAMCDIYLANVDPMLKVLHSPSLRNYLQGGAPNLDCSPGRKGLEALRFAIYFSAIVTLDEITCRIRFNKEKASLIASYRGATERALSKAEVAITTEMSTLQALTIYLSAVRATDTSRFMWSLVSLTIRIAQGMGLHLDVTSSHLHPFEREMRRRLWWQICALDTHAAEDRASTPVLTSDSFNTKLPLGINDDDIRFGSPAEIKERDGYHEMTFSLMCNEIFDAVRHINYVPVRKMLDVPLESPQAKWRRRLDTVIQTQRRIDQKYVRFFDMAVPFQWTAKMIADLVTATMWLFIYRPLQKDTDFPVTYDGNADVLVLSVDVLERAIQLYTNPMGANFLWLARTHVQWHAIAITAAELCVRKEGPVVERAWAILGLSFYENAKDVADSEKGMLWAPIKKLMNRARQVRHEYLSSLSANFSAQELKTAMPLSHQVSKPASYEATFESANMAHRTITSSTFPPESLHQANLTPSLGPFDWETWLASQLPSEIPQPNDIDMSGLMNWESFMDDVQHQEDVNGWLGSYGATT